MNVPRVALGAAAVAVTVLGPGCSDDSATSTTTVSSTVVTSTVVTSTIPAPPPSPARCSGEEAVADATLELRVEPSGTLETGPTSWAVTVTNRGSAPVELVYPTTQDADVTLRDREGHLAYRWSRAQAFSSVRRCQVLSPGQSATHSLGGVLRARPGTYLLEATLTAHPAPPAFEARVSVLP